MVSYRCSRRTKYPPSFVNSVWKVEKDSWYLELAAVSLADSEDMMVGGQVG